MAPLRVDASIHDMNTAIKATVTVGATAVAKTPLVISGTTLPADSNTEVTINGQPATVLFSTNGRIAVAMPGAVAVNTPLSVVVKNNRGGTSPAAPLLVSPVISSLSAGTGSTNVGQVVTVYGAGFTQAPVINFATTPAAVLDFGFGWAKVVVPAAAAGESDVTALVNGVAAKCISDVTLAAAEETTFACPKYKYDAALVAAVTSVSATTVSAGDSLTIQGTFPVEQNAVLVFAEGSECKITSISETEAVCTVSDDAVAGDYTNAYLRFAAGASAPITVTVSLTAALASNVASGTTGGAELEFTGAGFGAASSTAPILIQSGGQDICQTIGYTSLQSCL